MTQSTEATLHTVADYSDEQLLSRVMRGLDHPSAYGRPMWVAAQHTFGLGIIYFTPSPVFGII